ncbi:crotonobetainyl-CoA:carnitine CoA-transferase CaiB-like acyl-CoA transferase [Sphingopyxis panaciterrae]|uniref:CaiB/BaiF CoA transferase family protein n=1 Tax=Sphingopyxis panaciterrae TaxID=363841 RepID=UPI001FBA9C74|nr:CoA transferase [Sphingopyxis panaciterrae]NIJ39198.1 crotonobetainyl-CoA:carnitine CoA-transferase CaiB-like acyl-CoA transferase [Sphingopyxis panaciterrae]
MPDREPAPKPLAGIRVVELARVLAGPWSGQLLADLGAEVIKVERPGAGDDTREWGPPFVTGADGANLGAAYYHSCNRGKQSVAIDIASAEGQAAVRALLADADVIIENYKVGGLVKYGLDPARLRADFPRLIVCSVTGFGQTGPYAHRAGYDYIVQAMSGFMSLTGEPGGAPQKAGIAYADIFTGMYATVAILAALRRRDNTGAGAHIDMALLDSQVAVLANQAANYLASGIVPKRMGNGHVNVVPYQVFATADGQLVIAVGNDSQYRKLCAILGMPEWGDDPRFFNNAARLANRAELIPLLAAKIAAWDAQPLSLALEAEGVPSGPINDMAGVFADPQVIARGLRFRPEGASIDGVASPIVIDGERMIAVTGAPPLGG